MQDNRELKEVIRLPAYSITKKEQQQQQNQNKTEREQSKNFQETPPYELHPKYLKMFAVC